MTQLFWEYHLYLSVSELKFSFVPDSGEHTQLFHHSSVSIRFRTRNNSRFGNANSIACALRPISISAALALPFSES